MLRATILVLIALFFMQATSARISIAVLRNADTNANLLNAGVKNFIRIHNLPESKRLKVSSSGGRIVKTAFPDVYKVEDLCTGNDTIDIFLGDDIIYTAVFVVVPPAMAIPGKPRLTLAGVYCPDVSTAEILANPKLVTEPSTCLVKHFTLTVLPKRGEFVGPFAAEGPELTPRQLSAIKASGKRDRIFIEDIRVNCPGSDTLLTLPALSYITR